MILSKEEKREEGKYMRLERYEGDMSRSITLPTQIEPEKVEATYEHGVLTLRIPKSESALPRQISLKVKQEIGVC